MAKPLQLTRDSAGLATNGSQQSRESPQFTQTMELTIDVVTAVIIPSINGSKKMAAFFCYTDASTVFLCPTATPTLTLPTGTVTLSTNEIILNGSGRVVYAGQAIQLLSPDADVYLTIAYYEIL